jgi:membrane protein implicated in regulation of membrane protease activity
VVGLTVIPVGLVFLLFVLPWWASAVLWVVTPVSLVLLEKKFFPPVAAEPYGSARDVKRSAIRFWLIAPPVLILTCLVFWEIFIGD